LVVVRVVAPVPLVRLVPLALLVRLVLVQLVVLVPLVLVLALQVPPEQLLLALVLLVLPVQVPLRLAASLLPVLLLLLRLSLLLRRKPRPPEPPALVNFQGILQRRLRALLCFWMHPISVALGRLMLAVSCCALAACAGVSAPLVGVVSECPSGKSA